MAGLNRSLSYAAVLAALAPRNIPHTIEHGGKHPKVRFINQYGRNCMVVVSSSESDVRAGKNARRQTLQELEKRCA